MKFDDFVYLLGQAKEFSTGTTSKVSSKSTTTSKKSKGTKTSTNNEEIQKLKEQIQKEMKLDDLTRETTLLYSHLLRLDMSTEVQEEVHDLVIVFGVLAKGNYF